MEAVHITPPNSMKSISIVFFLVVGFNLALHHFRQDDSANAGKSGQAEKEDYSYHGTGFATAAHWLSNDGKAPQESAR